MKKIIVLSCISAGYFLNAQTIGNSPYAAFGIGDVKYDNTIDISAMGGISTAYVNDFNNKFNFDNPATNQNFGLTAFSLEASNDNNYFKSDYQNTDSKKHNTYLSNISLAFPLSKKVKFGLGYQPYSSKGYDIINTVDETEDLKRANRFLGKGTVSTVQSAISYHINESFSLGFRTNFYFGNITDQQEISYTNAELVNGFETTNKIKAFNFTGGTVYQKKFKNDRKLTVGATYTFGTTGNMETRYVNSTYYYLTEEDKYNVNIIEELKSEDKNLFPLEVSVGLGYGHEGKWFASTQMDYKQGQQIQFLGKPFNYEDSYRFSAGGWYLPNYNNFRNYFSRVIYRFGAYYEKGNLKLNNTNINELGISLGASLPFANTSINKLNTLDVAVEFGKRGTLDHNLINQNFVNLKLGLNFGDIWFRKAEFD